MFGDTIPFSYIILSARILGGKFAPPPSPPPTPLWKVIFSARILQMCSSFDVFFSSVYSALYSIPLLCNLYNRQNPIGAVVLKTKVHISGVPVNSTYCP